MLVRAVSNKRKRQILIGKLYAVYIKNKETDEIRIIDEAGGLSVYDLFDFEMCVQNVKSYEEVNNSLVYNLINYPTFLENYYNDDPNAINDLHNSQINIFKEDLSIKKIVKLIMSSIYSRDEKKVFIDSIENDMADSSVEMLAEYFQNEDELDSDLLLSICRLLSKYHNQEVYNLFLMYISDETLNNDEVQNIIVDYFNNYN